MNPSKPARLLSLDFFRGLTVAAMILVNNPGSWSYIYAPLAHAEWNGCTPTDLIFPFFLFIVGVSIAYSMGTNKLNPALHTTMLTKAVKRGLTLFALGLFLSLYPKIFTEPLEAIQNVRIPGVLQRIGLVFIACSFIFIKQSEKQIFRWIIVLLVGYWALMSFVPVPGTGYANLEKETNLGAWVDRTILTEAHLWKSAKTWDPEGLLSTLPAIATGLFGVLVGAFLKRKDKDDAYKIAWLFSVGTLAVIAGLIWDMNFPINKSLWTSSFVLYTGGLATIGLALSYWIIDVEKYNKLTKPFVVYGVNAITVFFVSGILPRTLNLIKIDTPDGEVGSLSLFYKTFFVPYFSPINASLIYAIVFILFFYVILHWMYKKNIIIKV